ncbi:MAG: CRISPR-associated helicase Cas3' [Bacteroidota bacterium]
MKHLYSHPGVPLQDHLAAVAHSCRKLADEKPIRLSFPKKILVDLLYLCGALHDTGKATSFFQHYLAHPEEPLTGPKHHALLSAILASEIVTQYLEKKSIPEVASELLPYYVFVAIRRHHGKLRDFNKELYPSEKAQDLEKQVDAIPGPVMQALLDQLLQPIGLSYNWTDFVSLIKSGNFWEKASFWEMDFFSEKFPDLPIETKADWHYLFQFMFGSLLLSDKRDVIFEKPLTASTERWKLERVENFRRKKGFHHPTTDLNRLKNQAYNTLLEEFPKRVRPDQHLYSISLPTGMGKTITALAAALALRERLDIPAAKLILAIPFTSIIDQNYEVYQEILGEENSALLLKHHHLSEPIYKQQEDYLDPDKSQFLIETWEAEMVVTTFVQILELFFTNDNSKILKFPQLAHSVVLLDEVQNIPYKLWPAIRAAFQAVGRMFNTYFIFMSATQPLIFDPHTEIQELIPHHEQYFQSPLFNRTHLAHQLPQKIAWEDFLETILAYLRTNPKKDILVILNTKKSARACFQRVTEHFGEEQAYFLSTLITPYERKNIIQLIRKAGGKKRKIIVSTQLIEAGVDISVDAIFRVIAPMDSIIQAAGRANRYFHQPEAAPVFLYEIEEHLRIDGKLYGSELLQKTRLVLADSQACPETGYLDLIQAYFQEVQKQASSIHSSVLEHLLRLEFEQLGEFEFIQERKTESVFIQLNEQAQAVWEQYKALFQREDLTPWQKRSQFRRFKASFYDYVINVPIPWDQQTIDFDGEKEMGFYVSYLEQPSGFYSYYPTDYQLNTGYESSNTHAF